MEDGAEGSSKESAREAAPTGNDADEDKPEVDKAGVDESGVMGAPPAVEEVEATEEKCEEVGERDIGLEARSAIFNRFSRSFSF